MKYARRSVSAQDIRRYDMFAQVSSAFPSPVDPGLMLALQNLQQSRGFGSFKFPEGGAPASNTQPARQGNAGFQETEEDDLYA